MQLIQLSLLPDLVPPAPPPSFRFRPFTCHQLVIIQRKLLDGVSQYAIAFHFNVSQSTVSRVAQSLINYDPN